MSVSLFQKIKIVLDSRKIIKNWYLYPAVYFGFFRKEYVVFETRTDIKIKLRVHSTDLMAFTNVWLVGDYAKSGFEIDDNDTIIDVGAHIGLFALYAFQYCKKGRIYCFEPVRENYELLLTNLQMNNVKNVFPFQTAISGKRSSSVIYLSQDESGHSMYIPSSKKLEIKTTTLKDIIDENSINRCDLIKIDCEGAEYDIIESLPEVYFKKIRKIVMEYHFANSKPALIKNLIDKMRSLSYLIDVRKLTKEMGLLFAKHE